MTWYWWLVIMLLVFAFLTYAMRKRIRLMMKYKDDELVESLMDETFWQGQTAAQLMDSLGEPLDVDQKVMKTKVREVWKYEQTGKNRYGLKITLEDGFVVGWDQK
jgi:uncharacterized membrane protein